MEKSFLSTAKTNVLYGVIFLIPIAIMGLLFVKLTELLTDVADLVGIESKWGAGAAVVVALIALLVVCFAVGVLVRTKLGSISFEFLEARALKHLPGYELISHVLKGFAESDETHRPALISLHGPGTAVLGLIMEENDNDTMTIFVPASPAMTIGTIHVVQNDRVSVLDAGLMDTANCVTQWGIGTRKLLGDQPLPNR